ncbi:MAG: hypothetical protein HY291_21295 [Planctomycetes bacterium]|nr:hypothetical protein [Planctomycetota bacterium]
MRSSLVGIAAAAAVLSACLLRAEEPVQKTEETSPAGKEQPAKDDAAKLAQPVETRKAKNGAVYALLPNGCELIVKEKRNAPVVSVQGWVRTGANDEREFLGAGLSHYC